MPVFVPSARLRGATLLLFLGAAGSLFSQSPQWIWHDNHGAAPQDNEVRYFRKNVLLPAQFKKATLSAAADDQIIVFLNGKQVASSTSWQKPVRLDVTSFLHGSTNQIGAVCKNVRGNAGFMARLELELVNGQVQTFVSDATWQSAEIARATAANWLPAIILAPYGAAPWGDVFAAPSATPASQLTVPAGFKVELLRSALPEEGSWICMTFDGKGRLIVSPQTGGLLRLTLSPEAGAAVGVEKITTVEESAMGLLWAFDSLYFSGKGAQGTGLYRLRPSSSGDRLERGELLKKFEGGAGEHGAHAIRLGPDNRLYLMNGNATRPPEGLTLHSPYRHAAEDTLLPVMKDPVATFFDHLSMPYGYLVRTDAEGKEWEMVAAGLRNAYDFDFNPEGDLFTYESDMEWDVGLPWYRPTRILHGVSGGEYGFREGSGKWPDYYSDSLPAVATVGLGSPTGTAFGSRSHFPEKYKKAFFALDWAYGKIFAVHLRPEGASYAGTVEEFLSGKGLPVTDVEFGPDGAMYFITGGRGTQSGLYRVTYMGNQSGGPAVSAPELAGVAERTLRRQLEVWHVKEDAAAIDLIWKHLGQTDRFIRQAARVALENQDVSRWQSRALAEKQTGSALTALLALARCGTKEVQGQLLEAALALKPATELEQLDQLRLLSVALARFGRPESTVIQSLLTRLEPAYPARNEAPNRELCQLLIFLESPRVVAKTMALLAAAPSQQEQIFYAFQLRQVRLGWTRELREAYFAWFNQALRDYKGGNSFSKFLTNARREAVATLGDAEKMELAALLTGQPGPAPKTVPTAQARTLVKEWTLAELQPLLEKPGRRSFSKGREAFVAAQCAACHRFNNEGGSVGPDITAAASRFNRRDLLEAILLPSRVISDQYQNLQVTRRDGEELSGLVVEETAQKLVLLVNPLTQARVEVAKADIQSRQVSKTSPMPEGLLNLLTAEEIQDMLAYIESGGNEKSPLFDSGAR